MVPGWDLPMKETHVWFERWKQRGRHYYLQAGTAICAARQVKRSEVAQSGPTLCDPIDCSLQGSSVHGIFQARILNWVTIPFSRVSSQPRDQTRVSCVAGRWATREARSKTRVYSNFPVASRIWPTFQLKQTVGASQWFSRVVTASRKMLKNHQTWCFMLKSWASVPLTSVSSPTVLLQQFCCHSSSCHINP